jgi:hypothetical protein
MKRPTFATQRTHILNVLKAQGWVVKPELKVPTATRRDGTMLLFKPQAVWAGHTSNRAGARSLHIDIRDIDDVADWVVNRLPKLLED